MIYSNNTEDTLPLLSKYSTPNLERWRYYLKDVESPDLYINWTWYSIISSALQRRVCFGGLPNENKFQIFPNLYVVFVGPPGVGKSIVANKAKELIDNVNLKVKRAYTGNNLIKVGPQATTLPGLIRYIATNFTVTANPKIPEGNASRFYHHCSLSLFCGDELENLLNSDSGELMSFLNIAWDCGSFHKVTATQGTDIIHNLCMTLLGCCTPEWIASSYTNKILKGGFAARTIFVYGGTKRKMMPFIQINDDQVSEYNKLIDHVSELVNLFGEVKLTKEANDFFINWYKNSNENRSNKDTRLDYYYERKKIMVMKVALCSHFSDRTDLILEVDDIKRALDFLEETEDVMHLALMYAGKNPLSSTALEILQFIKECGQPVSDVDILKRFFSTNSRYDIKGVLLYLFDTKQVSITKVKDRFYYKYIDNKNNEQ